MYLFVYLRKQKSTDLQVLKYWWGNL